MNFLSLQGQYGMENISAENIKEGSMAYQAPAYHVLSTAPYFAKNNSLKDYAMNEYMSSVMRLSALTWRKTNGEISLVTDEKGAEYIYKNNYEEYWDKIEILLDDFYSGIDPKKYWAAGKIFAVSKLKAPLVIVDLDFIVWKPLDFTDSDLTAIHFEAIDPGVYPSPDIFITREQYKFDPMWDFKASIPNTALFFINNEAFRKYYAASSIRFMKNERGTIDNGCSCMTFAEQRLAGECAKAVGLEFDVLLEYDRLSERQDYFTHIWNAKNIIVENPCLCKELLEISESCIGTLKNSQPLGRE